MKTFSAVYSLVTLALTVSVMFESAKWATSIPEVMSLFLLAAWAVWFLVTREQMPRAAYA